MMLLLKKNMCLSTTLPWQCFTACGIINQFTIDPSHHYKLTGRISLGFSTAAATTPFIGDFLVKSLGLPPLQATRASKTLAHLKSTSKPEKVVYFLKECGWTDARIRRCIAMRPRVLCSDVEKTLKPKLQALQELGFSHSEVIQLASESPAVFQILNLRPKIEFWRAMLCSNERLLKAFKRESTLLGYCIDKKIKPRISLLQECGISDSQLAQLILYSPRIMKKSPDDLKAIFSRVDRLGIPRGSSMFCYGVHCLSFMSEVKTEKKFKFLVGLGFTETEVRLAVKRFPFLLTLSDKKILQSMEFLLNEVGCKTSVLAPYANLLAMSFEKRLVPRHNVLQLLKAKDLLPARCHIGKFFQMGERKFLEKFVFSNLEIVPGLHEAYLAARLKEVPV